MYKPFDTFETFFPLIGLLFKVIPPHQLEVVGSSEPLLHDVFNPSNPEPTVIEVIINSFAIDARLPSLHPEFCLGRVEQSCQKN
jgi:hypothetical protein